MAWKVTTIKKNLTCESNFWIDFRKMRRFISIRTLRMRVISAIIIFYWSHAIALQNLSNERSYKFSWILTLTEVMSIRIVRMRIISTIMNFY